MMSLPAVLDVLTRRIDATFRRALGARLERERRPVVELDSDGFHHPRAIRYRQGRDSPRGYYEDAYDLDAVARLVLDPLGPGGDRVIATAIHDLRTDATLMRTTDVARDAVVLFDCTFIQRGALRSRWDLVVHLEVDETVARRRGIERDRAALGGEVAAAAAYDTRYLAACRIYRDEEHPTERADIVIDTTEPGSPRLMRG